MDGAGRSSAGAQLLEEMTDASHIIMVKIYVIIELEQYDLEADQTVNINMSSC